MPQKKMVSLSGFTLIELLFVITLILIFARITYPAFKNNFNALQLNSFSKKLQALFIYLHEQSIVERKIIYLTIDSENKKCWAKIDGQDYVLESYRVPEGIRIETEQKQMAFYPDGSIDKVAISLRNTNNQAVKLTTRGIFGGVKLETQ